MGPAGGLRADFVKGPQTPHSTFSSRRSIPPTLVVETIELRWDDECVGVGYLGCIDGGMGDVPDRLALTGVSQVSDSRKFLRSKTGHIAALSLPRVRGLPA